MARIKRERKLDEINKLPNDIKLPITRAAELIGVGRSTMYDYVDCGFIKVCFTRDRKRRRVVGSEIKRFCRVN